jgi:signal transduction histidine kinase
VNLSSLLGETLALVENQARIQKVELWVDLPPGPVSVRGVRGLLQQVFMNLFLNALNAMPHGGCLRVSTDCDFGEVAVYIADDGRGMSRSEMEKIFDPFYTRAPVGKGTGLGLSICYSIVKQHFGSIEVASREGEGSTFVVRLPRF